MRHLFYESLEDENEDNIIDSYQNYTLVVNDIGNDMFEYKIFDPEGDEIPNLTYKSNINALNLSLSEYRKSIVKSKFLRNVFDEIKRSAEAKQKEFEKKYSSLNALASYTRDYLNSRRYDDYDDYDDYDTLEIDRYRPRYSYTYTPPKKSTGFLDKLNKSDTLVIHCEDRSTDMLSQIYEGKNWDILRDGNIDKSELHKLLESHDRIVMLGHGTPSGLINKQGSGYVIGDEEAPYLKGKKLFVIWCNADKYFDKHNIGDGQFITGNMPSEVWECKAAGCGDISSQLMLENITYWSKLCADVVEKALNGDAQGAVDYIRKHYIDKYGNHKVTIYNAERTKVQGKPMEDLSDLYWGDESESDKFNSSQNSFSSKIIEPIIPKNQISKWLFKDSKYIMSAKNASEKDKSKVQEFIDNIESILDKNIGLDKVEYWSDIISFRKSDENKIIVKEEDTPAKVYEISGNNLKPIS